MVFVGAREQEAMNKWLPLAVVGLGGLGILALSDRGLEIMGRLLGRLEDAPQRFLDWNEAAQRELDRIESALNRMANSLEPIQ
jgi:hypothetical protein